MQAGTWYPLDLETYWLGDLARPLQKHKRVHTCVHSYQDSAIHH